MKQQEAEKTCADSVDVRIVKFITECEAPFEGVSALSWIFSLPLKAGNCN